MPITYATPRVSKVKDEQPRALRALLTVVAGLVIALLALAPRAEAITLPAQFSDSLVTTVDGPTALDFTPDGRVIVTSQFGKVYVRFT